MVCDLLLELINLLLTKSLPKTNLGSWQLMYHTVKSDSPSTAH
jgi:hypothetical protein